VAGAPSLGMTPRSHRLERPSPGWCHGRRSEELRTWHPPGTTSMGSLRGGLTTKTVSVRLGKEREKRAYRGLSLIRNPYILPAGVSRRAGADPLLSFHPSRVLTLPAMTGHAPYLLPCT
jgi:hypothetical protein